MFYNFARHLPDTEDHATMAAGVTDRLWEIKDIVAVLEAWDALNARRMPTFEIERERIGEGYFVRISPPDEALDTVYGFATEVEAVKWIRNESQIWLYEKRKR